MKFGIGRGKDLSSAAVKIGLKTKPLSFVGVSFTRIEIYNMGDRNSFTWPEVSYLSKYVRSFDFRGLYLTTLLALH